LRGLPFAFTLITPERYHAQLRRVRPQGGLLPPCAIGDGTGSDDDRTRYHPKPQQLSDGVQGYRGFPRPHICPQSELWAVDNLPNNVALFSR
jgi:hypothetical protein